MLDNLFSGKMALRNVESVQLFDTVTGELFAESFTLKAAPINQTIDVNYATGGQGNSRMAVFKSNKNIEIPFTDALFDIALLSEQAGETEEKITSIVFDKIYTTTVADTATIDHALSTGGDITVEEVTADDDRTPIRRFTQVASSPAANEYSISGTTITFFLGDVSIGTFIRVIQNADTTHSVTVTTSYANKFAGTYKAVMSVPVEDLVTSKVYMGQITIYRAALSEGFTFNFANDGEVSIHEATLYGLANVNNKKLWELVIFSEETDLT